MPYKDPEKRKKYSHDYNVRRWKDDREKQSSYARTYWTRVKIAVLTMYGGLHPRCACCGEDNFKLLNMDHVAENGKAHRKELGLKGGGNSGNLYGWLRSHGYPNGFQILCYSCNQGKSRNHGVCPHVEYFSSTSVPQFETDWKERGDFILHTPLSREKSE